MKLSEFQEQAKALIPDARTRRWRPEYEPNVVYDVVAESDRFTDLVPGPRGTPRAVFLRPERGMVYLSPDMLPPDLDLSLFPPYRAAVQGKKASLKAWLSEQDANPMWPDHVRATLDDLRGRRPVTELNEVQRRSDGAAALPGLLQGLDFPHPADGRECSRTHLRWCALLDSRRVAPGWSAHG